MQPSRVTLAAACRLASPICVIAIAILLGTATPALAAPPETPEAKPATAITATTATLNGVLNPGGESEGGSYQFSYAPSETECAGGGVAPLSPALSVGAASEAVSTPVTGLQPKTEYAVCLTAFSLFFNEPSAPSPAETFTTPAAAPSIDGESTSAVTSTTATLEAQVNANNEATTYVFEYSTEQSAGVLQGTIVTVPAAPAGPLEGFGDQTASAPTETLLPDTTYFYRVVATNATGTQDGPVSETGFTTVAAPTTEAATGVTSTTATFHGTLTPLTETVGAEAEYHFDYAQGSEDCTTGTSTPPTGAGPGKAAQAVEAEVTNLQPGATYSVCLVSSNPFGSELDPATPQQQFTTLAGPPSIEGETATAITPEGVTLETTVNPNNQESTCSFEYSTDASLTTGVTTVPCSAPLGAGNAPATGSATVTGLELKQTYFYRAVAENAAHEKTTDPTTEHFETEATVAPSLEGEEAKDITATTATLAGKVNPNGAQVKACVFEYGTDTGYGTTAPCANPDAAEVGAGREPVAVSAALTELKANVTYHWRLTATTAAGTTTSVDHTFVDDTEPATPPGSCPGQEQIRQEAHSANLPDCRAYEMVTPPQKSGSLIGSVFGGGLPLPQIADSGADVMAISLQCLAGTESCTGIRGQEGEPYEFARTSQGWVTHPLAPPATQYGITTEWAASANTHTTLFSAPSPTEAHDNFYARTGSGAPAEVGPVSENGRLFRGLDIGQPPVEATDDFSHMLFAATEGADLWSLDARFPESKHSIYEYVGRGSVRPLAVGVSGPSGSTTRVSECPTFFGGSRANQPGRAFGSLSVDGRVAFFTAEGHSETSHCSAAAVAPAANELLERVDGEGPGAHSVLVSASTPAACTTGECHAAQSAPQNAEFEGASSDGSRVFFTSAQQLSDNASSGESNLYESVCVLPCGDHGEEPVAKERVLVDVSEAEGSKPAVGGPQVQGVMAISSDGSQCISSRGADSRVTRGRWGRLLWKARITCMCMRRVSRCGSSRHSHQQMKNRSWKGPRDSGMKALVWRM